MATRHAPWPRKDPNLSRSVRRAQSYAVPDAELHRLVQQLISVMMSVPESERIGWYRGLERFARHERRTGRYNIAKVAGLALRLADATWDSWPPQWDDSGGSE